MEARGFGNLRWEREAASALTISVEGKAARVGTKFGRLAGSEIVAALCAFSQGLGMCRREQDEKKV